MKLPLALQGNLLDLIHTEFEQIWADGGQKPYKLTGQDVAGVRWPILICSAKILQAFCPPRFVGSPYLASFARPNFIQSTTNRPKTGKLYNLFSPRPSP